MVTAADGPESLGRMETTPTGGDPLGYLALDTHALTPGDVRLSDGELLLCRPTEGLVPEIHSACQDPALHRWLTALPDPYTEQDAVDYVRTQAQAWVDGTERSFAITDAGDGRLLGMIGLRDLSALTAPGGGMGEVGYWVAAAERGRGVATRALRLVCRWGFDELRLGRIEWQAELGNDASRRAAEAVGFVVEGTTRRRLLHRGHRVDGWLAALLPEDLPPEAPLPETPLPEGGR
jgi:RimJ/RimL family protein N-acetyltransferase